MTPRRLILPVAILWCVAAIQFVQPTLAKNVHKVRQRDDAFILPPPEQLKVMTFGYRAAATDLLWAKLILEFGVHHVEKRPFPDITRYVDAILAIEPDFPTVFDFVDTIIVYPPPPGGTEADARIARRYLEMGTVARPYDAQLWLHYGQFIAFIAPAFLTNQAEIERWRVEGANAIAHAVELGADTQRGFAASTVLNKGGERKASIENLQRLYAITDDADQRNQVLLKLHSMQADAASEEAISFVERELRQNYRFLSRGTGLMIGPRRPVIACAGPGSYNRRGCASDWTRAIEDTR